MLTPVLALQVRTMLTSIVDCASLCGFQIRGIFRDAAVGA
jgi:hypothetical protein